MNAIAIFDHFDTNDEAAEHHDSMNHLNVWRRLLQGHDDKNLKALPYEDRAITDTWAYRVNRDNVRIGIERLVEHKSAAVARQKRQAAAAARLRDEILKKANAEPVCTTGFDWADDMEEAVEMRENNVEGWEDRFAHGMEIDEMEEIGPAELVSDDGCVNWSTGWATDITKSPGGPGNDDLNDIDRPIEADATTYNPNSKSIDEAKIEICGKSDSDWEEIEDEVTFENRKENNDEEDEETSDEDITMETSPTASGSCSTETTIELQNLESLESIDFIDLPLDADGQITLHYDGASARSPFNPHQAAEQGSFKNPSRVKKMKASRFNQAFLEAARSELEDTDEFKRRFRLPLSQKRWLHRAKKNHADELERAEHLVITARCVNGMNRGDVKKETPLNQVILIEDWMAEDEAGSSAA
ncbi:hypothetical protein ACHAQH_003159 [Verticillium albo-atrum]